MSAQRAAETAKVDERWQRGGGAPAQKHHSRPDPLTEVPVSETCERAIRSAEQLVVLFARLGDWNLGEGIRPRVVLLGRCAPPPRCQRSSTFAVSAARCALMRRPLSTPTD